MKSTKKAFLLSIVSMLLCVAMLMGTTLAWFTDTVTSGVNKIVAGNLDIEVSYLTKNADGTVKEASNPENWADLEEADSVFSSNLWEPGHTEFVTLKIENKGTLAFKYRMNVTPVNEKGGINVNGESFKLSDYLVWKTTAPSVSDSTPANRDAARSLATGTEMKLNQSALTQNGVILANGDAQYITLVVYMPETVGNVANYKTGTTAPEIELGIKFIATQYQYEKDSFDDDYDKDIDYPAIDTVIAYNYFPQVSYVAQLKKSENKAVKDGEDAQITEDNDKITITSVDKSGDNAFVKASFGNNAIATYDDNGKAAVRLNAKKTEEGNLTVGGIDMESVTYDISVEATTGTLSDDTLYTVELFIGEGKQHVTLSHLGADMHCDNSTPTEADHFYYNSATGYITMVVNHFSAFESRYNAPVAAVGTTAFYSIATAAKAAKEDNASLFVMRDTQEEEAVDLSGVVLELNGKEVKLAEGSTLPAGKTTDESGKVVECQHDNLTYTLTATGHKGDCACGFVTEEEHTFGENGVCVCGYKSDAKLLEENPNATARIGMTAYTTLLAAINAAQDGDTVALLVDATTGTSCLNITKSITLDFGTSILTSTRTSFPVVALQINAPGKTVTFKGTTGGIKPNAGTGCVCVKNGNLVIDSGEYVTTNAAVVTDDTGTKTLTVNGGKLTAMRSSGYGRLINDFAGDVTINGGELYFKNTGNASYMYLIEMDGTGYTCTINGGTITADGGKTAYTDVIKDGDNINVNINGGNVINANAQGSYVRLVESSSATVVIKDINYQSVASAYGCIANAKSLTIEGGTFNMSPASLRYGFVITGQSGTEKITTIQGKISGGTFTFHPGAFYRSSILEKNYDEVIAEGYEAVQNDDNTWSVVKAD